VLRTRHGRAAVLLLLAALAIALGVASDALARDPPNQGRRAGRIAAKALPPNRIAPAPGFRAAAASRPAGAWGRNGRSAAATAFPHNGAPNAFLHHQEARRAEHRREILQARSRLPQHPLPGERGFTGVPPPGETRFVSNEMVFHVAPNISRQAVENVARKLNLSMVASHNVGLTGGTMFRLGVADGRSVADAVRALEAEKLGVAQPNYVFKLQQDPKLAARTQSGELDQYVVNKLRLGEVHRVATGSNVLVAVIEFARRTHLPNQDACCRSGGSRGIKSRPAPRSRQRM
jgi:hypothetical protein